MFFHSLRISWHFPIEFNLISENLFRDEFKWLRECSHGMVTIEKIGGGMIRSFGILELQKRSLKPILDRHYLIRSKKKLSFPPIIQFSTNSKRISVVIEREFSEKIKLNSIYYRMKCYPIGGIIIDLLFNFHQKPFAKELTFLNNNICLGNKRESCSRLIYFLYSEIIKSLFSEPEFQSKLLKKVTLPNPTYNLFMNTNEDPEKRELKLMVANIFPAIKSNPSSVAYAHGLSEKELVIFHKSGSAFYSPDVFSKEMKSTRQHLKKNLDYIVDLAHIVEILLDRFLNRNLIKYQEDFESIQSYLDTIIVSCDPLLISSFSQRESLLPSSALRAWFKLMSKLLLLKVRYEKAINSLFQKIESFQLIALADFLSRYSTSYLPSFQSRLIKLLKILNISLSSPIDSPLSSSLSKKEKELFELLEEFVMKDLKDFIFGDSKTKLAKIRRVGIGYRVRHQIGKQLEMTGRYDYKLKSMLRKFEILGLVDIKPNPKREGSNLYRIAIKHPYFQLKFKRILTKYSIDLDHFQNL